MSNLFIPPKAIIVGSFLFRNDLISKADLLAIWQEKFKNSNNSEFDFCPMKEYYSKEMGNIKKLSRFFVYSIDPVERELFVEFKIWADQLERHYLRNNNRIFNFDIGLLTLENFILATGKPYSHRIYLQQGIYGELTYIYQNHSFQVLPWTYPDYAQREIIEFFNSLRQYSQKY